MYEKYSRQALPPRNYRELLGSALCVFNANAAFIIEVILDMDYAQNFSWYDLIDKESGNLVPYVKDMLGEKNSKIAKLFKDVVEMRNRIVHSFQITLGEKQILATKTRKKDGNIQFHITEDYLLDFIKKNEELCEIVDDIRSEL